MRPNLPSVVGFVLLLVQCGCSSEPASAPAVPSNDAGPPDATERETDANDQPASDKVTISTESLVVGGTAREYLLAVPKNLDPEKQYPLVLVFHGDGGTGPSMRKSHTFDVVSGDEAIVAYPTGIDHGWDTQSPTATNRDLQFIEKLASALSAKHRIDADRIFGTGYSSGGFLVNKIACRKTGFFRGIVSHAGGAPYEDADPDATEWPSGYTKCAGQSGGVAAMIVHGDADGEVTPDSGEFDATYWAALNGCQDTSTDSTPSPCKKHDGCPANMPVLWCLIPGLGHTVWDKGAAEGWAFMKSL